MKILFVNNKFTYGTANYGGVNKMILWLGNSLANRGYDVTFCTLYDTYRSERIVDCAKSIQLSIPYENNTLKRYFSLFTNIRKKIKYVIQNGEYDYVISFDGLVFFDLLLLRLQYKFKLIVSERADPNYDNNIVSKFKRKCYRFADLLVCQTEGAKKCFSKVIRNKTVVIPNPIVIPNEKWDLHAIQSEIHSIATVGRLHIWQKRQDVLLEAFKIVHDKLHNCVLNIYGSGPDEHILKKKAEDMGISSRVNFHGAVNEVNSLLLKNELFILTSDFEGIPNALLEAMALGMPVISTRCSPGGAELLIEDNVNGFLIKCRDYVGLAERIIALLQDNDKKVDCGDKARESMKRFLPETIINTWDIILNENYEYKFA